MIAFPNAIPHPRTVTVIQLVMNGRQKSGQGRKQKQQWVRYPDAGWWLVFLGGENKHSWQSSHQCSFHRTDNVNNHIEQCTHSTHTRDNNVLIKFGHANIAGIAMFAAGRAENVARRAISISQWPTQWYTLSRNGCLDRSRYRRYNAGIHNSRNPQCHKGHHGTNQTTPKHGIHT